MPDASNILDKFPHHMGRPPTYPWEEWTDGQVRELIQGVHFFCESQSFRTIVHRTARKRKLKARTRTNKDRTRVIVVFYEDK